MRKKMIWGIAPLIVLLIGVSAVLLMRTTDTQEKTVYIDVEPSKDNPPPDEPGYKWVWHHTHWDKVKISTANEVVEHSDAPITERSDGSPQTTSVSQPNLLVDSDFDFAAKLPTEAELPRYSERELAILVHAALHELSDAQDKYVALTTSLREAHHKNRNDMKTGIIDSKSFWEKYRELSYQERKITRAYLLRRSERKEQLDRIQQYRDTLK